MLEPIISRNNRLAFFQGNPKNEAYENFKCVLGIQNPDLLTFIEKEKDHIFQNIHQAAHPKNNTSFLKNLLETISRHIHIIPSAKAAPLPDNGVASQAVALKIHKIEEDAFENLTQTKHDALHWLSKYSNAINTGKLQS